MDQGVFSFSFSLVCVCGLVLVMDQVEIVTRECVNERSRAFSVNPKNRRSSPESCLNDKFEEQRPQPKNHRKFWIGLLTLRSQGLATSFVDSAETRIHVTYRGPEIFNDQKDHNGCTCRTDLRSQFWCRWSAPRQNAMVQPTCTLAPVVAATTPRQICASVRVVGSWKSPHARTTHHGDPGMPSR